MKRGRLALFTTLILGLVAPHVVRQSRSMRSIAEHKHYPRSSASSHDARLLEYRSLPLGFEANQGQTAEEVKFLARGNGYSLFLTGNEAVLALRKASAVAGPSVGQNPQVKELPLSPKALVGGHESRTPWPQPPPPTVVRMKLVGANLKAPLVGLRQLPGKSNYFVGNDPKKWRTNVSTYAKVRYKDVYPGVDLVYHGNQGQLEYDFVVAPGADPKAISLSVAANYAPRETDGDGTPPLEIDRNGDLLIRTQGGEVRFQKPLVYQATGSASNSQFTPHHSQLVKGRYVLRDGNQVGFEVRSYDHTKRLVIDPVLSYSTYLGSSNLSGGSNLDVGYGVAVDSSGNAYVTGYTNSSDFPTLDSFQATNGGGQDAFVTKLNPTGSGLVYSTYLGGSGNDVGTGIVVDSSGNAYVVGSTDSTNFPTLNPFQATVAGGTDAFVTKLNPTGSALVYSTYLGGSGDDVGASIVADSSGNAYVAGLTSSTNFPTLNPFQATNGGGRDAFVTKLNPTGSGLVYSTYLGGRGDDVGTSIVADSSGNAYVTGFTDSTDFPTLNPFQATSRGGNDAFVTKLNPMGSALVYSTYLGGSGNDGGAGIAVDSSGNAYITGSTASIDFPTSNAFQASLAGNFDAFVAKLDAAGNALVYSTYFGSYDTGSAIAVDASGSAYVAGTVEPFPGDIHSSNAVERCGFVIIPNFDAFVTQLKPDGTGLVFSTCLGGDLDTAGFGIALDSSGSAYVTGCTDSATFATTSEAFQRTGGGGDCVVFGAGDAFVSKISPLNATAVSLAPAAMNFSAQVVGTTSALQDLHVLNVGNLPLTINSIAITGTNGGDFVLQPYGNRCSIGTPLNGGGECDVGVTFTPTAQGARTATVTVTDNAPDSPQTIPLSGTGTTASAATLSAATLSFGNDIVGVTSAAQPLTVTSSGSANLIISTVSVAGTNASDFTMQSDSCNGATVAPGSTCSVALFFKPSVSGLESATLNIADNASSSPQTAVLTGTGQDFSVSSSPASATITAGQSTTFTLSVASVGGFNQAVNLSCSVTIVVSQAPACSVSPTSLTPSGSAAATATVTVTTTARGWVVPNNDRRLPPLPDVPLGVWIAIGAALTLSVATARRLGPVSRMKPAPAALLSACLLLSAIWTGCSGGGSSSGPPHPTGTPAGNYTLTVTGTSQGVSHTVNLTLTVN
jgi:hypothetical protein